MPKALAQASLAANRLAYDAAFRAAILTGAEPELNHANPALRVVCQCETVTESTVRACLRTGLAVSCTDSVKWRTRCGMGPCQGRQCGLTVTELVADASGVSPGEVGYFRIRPPIKPITLGELAHAV